MAFGGFANAGGMGGSPAGATTGSDLETIQTEVRPGKLLYKMT